MPVNVQVRQQGLEASIQAAMKKAGKNLRINLGNTRNIDALSQPLGKLTGRADEFTKSMEAANARVLAFGASVGVIAGISKGFQELIKTTIQVEKSLTSINSILRQSSSQLDSFKKTLFDVAKNTEQTFDTVATAALELSRQGLKSEEVTKRLNDALILSRLSGLDAADAVSGLTAAINTFSNAGITSEQVLNKISAAAASAAVSDRDLIEGLKRSGSVANATGVQFDELVGIISALQERTARGGAVIGNSLKTIFTRIQDLERLKTLQNLGVQVTDFQGEVLSANKIIENLAPTFAKLDQASKVNLADNLVGKFQIAPFLALLEDYNQEVSRSSKVAEVSFGATNEAYQRNVALNKTLSASINETVVNLRELGNTLGEIGVTDNLKSIISFFDTFISGIQGLLEGDSIGSKFAKGIVKGIGGVLAGPGLALALAIVAKLTVGFAKFGTESLRTFFGLNQAAKEQALLQGQITSSLLNDSGIRKQILSIERQSISVEEKRRKQTEAITIAINTQLQAMRQMQGIAASITPGVLAGTSKARRSAGGFLPIGAEKADISKGVGGAPPSAKPVVIPNFAFGGGKRGTMVANDSEYIVPNYANGGDAIFNQKMASSMGIPANAKKIRAAGGYIPNFAARPENEPDSAIITKVNGKRFQQALAAGRLNREQQSYYSQYQSRGLAGQRKRAKSSLFQIDGSRYGIASIFPDKKTDTAKTAVPQLNSDLAKRIAAGGAKNIQFKGIQVKSLNDMEANLEKEEGKFKNKIADFFAGPLAGFGANILGSTFSGNDREEMTKKISQIKSGGQGVGLFSSSVEGGIFESAINLITKKASGLSAFKDVRDEQRPFDFEEGSNVTNAFRNTFGFSDRLKRADAKRTASAGAVNSVIKKAFNDPSEKAYLTAQAKKQEFLNASKGYIPNYAIDPLQNAIGREQAAGVPLNQIRINQSGKLRNSQNPQGIAVTNTRDEPTGAIPNFVSGAGIQQTNFEAFEKSSKNVADTNNQVSKANRDYLGIIFGVQAGLSALTAATGDSESALGRYTNIIADSASTVTSFAFAGSAVKSFGDSFKDTEGKLAGFKGGLGKVVGSLGTLGVVAGAAFGAFKLGTELYNEYSGANIRAANALARVKDSADSLSFAFETLSNVEKEDVKQRAESILNKPVRTRIVVGKSIKDSGFSGEKEVGIFRNFGVGEAAEQLKSEFSKIAQGFVALGEEDELKKTLARFGEDLDDVKLAELSDEFDLLKKASEKRRNDFEKFLQGLDESSFDFVSKNPVAGPFTKGFRDSEKIPDNIASDIIGKERARRSQKEKEDTKAVNRLNIEAAQARLRTQIEIRKVQLDSLDDLDKQIIKAEALGTVDSIRLNELKNIQEIRGLDTSFAQQNLDFLLKQVSEMKSLGAETGKIKAINDLISGSTVKTLSSKEGIESITKQIKELDQDNNEILNNTVKNLIDSVSERFEAFDLTKKQKKEEQELNAIYLSRTELLKEANFQSRLSAENAAFNTTFGSQRRVGNLEADNSRRQQRIDQEGLSPKEIAAEEEIIRRNNQLIEREKQIVQKRADLLKNAQGFDVPIESGFTGDLSSIGNVGDIIKQLKDSLNFTVDDDARRVIQEQISNLEQQKKNLDLEESQLKDQQGIQSLQKRAYEIEITNLENRASRLKDFGGSPSDIAKLEREAEALRNANGSVSSNEALKKSELGRGFGQRILEDSRFDPTVTSSRLKDDLIDGSYQFLLNMGDAFGNALSQTDDLGDALLTISRDFLKGITSAFANKFISDAFGNAFGGTGIKKAASGGYISGGSGVKDDVPAMLMGGEYVMRKSAVNKYGASFMNALNNGAIEGYASGGIVRQKRDKEGMFTTPGFNGAGSISGASNLLSFATQTPAALTRDSFLFGGGASGSFLDPESARLTNFGRRNNRQFGQVQSAKQQAFDLFVSQRSAEAEARQREKDFKDQFKRDLIGAGVSSLVGSGLSELGKFSRSKGLSKLADVIDNSAGFGGNILGAIASGGSSYSIFGGFGAGASRNGKSVLDELFGEKVNLSNLDSAKALTNITKSASDRFTGGISTGPANSGKLNTSTFAKSSPSIPNPITPTKADINDLFDDSGIFTGRGMLPKLATGGIVPRTAGVDTVPAMLSGGEFVMNQAATQRIGSGNLQSLNSGGSLSGDNSEMISKLEELIVATENASSGEINITINSDQTESKSSSNASEDQRKLSEKIKTVVKQVISDEKRLGGKLRM